MPPMAEGASPDGGSALDAILALLDGPQGQRVQDRRRAELAKSIPALRRCLAATPPAPLTTLTIRVLGDDWDPEGRPSRPAGDGVYLDVEGIRIGRTGRDGTLTADVPSGEIRITATDYSSYSWGENIVTLAPAAPDTVSVVLQEGKEPTEDSDLVLEEAPDDILPVGASSLTLKFVQDDAPVRIRSIEEIGASATPDDAGENLAPFFAVRDGVMHATDVTAVYSRLARYAKIGRPLSLTASGVDTEGRSHYGTVAFQLGRWRLAVRLAAPPSNPTLPVSDVAVRVSVMGSGAVTSRVSDAEGRFEIPSLPDATLAFDAHTVASGIHYYADATLTLCADRSVTITMRNVKDLVAGVPALVIDSGTSPCPPLPRR